MFPKYYIPELIIRRRREISRNFAKFQIFAKFCSDKKISFCLTLIFFMKYKEYHLEYPIYRINEYDKQWITSWIDKHIFIGDSKK